MDYVKIPQLDPYPLAQLQDEDLFEICYWNGTTFLTRKVSGAVIKAAAGGSAVWGDITGDIEDQSDLIALVATKFDIPTGSNTDYLDGAGNPTPFPTIPAAQVNSDWNAVSGIAEILNKPSSLPPSGTASGDLSGSYPSPTVSKIHGVDVQSGTPADLQFLQYTTSGNKWKHHTLTSTDVGLGNVANLAPADLPISTATQTALNDKAPLASPSFTGTPLAPTAPLDTNTTQVATTAFVVAQIEQQVDTDIPYLSATEQRRGFEALNGSTTIISYNGVTITETGSTNALTTTPTSNVQFPRKRYYTINGTTNMQVGTQVTTGASFMNITRGFRFQAMFCPSDQSTGGTEWYVPGARQFVGMSDSLTLLAISSTTTVISQTNIIGVGSDAGDANLSIFHNDILGSATKIDLGASFPAGKTSAVNFPDVYYVEFYCSAGSGLVAYRVTNLYTGAVARGTLSNNLPIATSRLVPQIVRTSGSTSQNISMDIGCMFNSSLF